MVSNKARATSTPAVLLEILMTQLLIPQRSPASRCVPNRLGKSHVRAVANYVQGSKLRSNRSCSTYPIFRKARNALQASIYKHDIVRTQPPELVLQTVEEVVGKLKESQVPIPRASS
eukprot:1158935-Pelagomonas_calceolata.AAC.1